MSKLNEITLKGFRSIVETTIELQSLNVLIGANGAGKSNLIAFFKMLNEMMAGRLQQFVASTGRGTDSGRGRGPPCVFWPCVGFGVGFIGWKPR